MPERRPAGAALLLAALSAAPALASDPGGHVADVGALAYVEGGDRGGGLLEGRLNLARSDPATGLYLTAALGTGSWLQTTRPTDLNKIEDAVFIVPWVVKELTGGYKTQAENWTDVRTQQNVFLDAGLAATTGHWNFSGGVTVLNYSLDVLKQRDAQVFATPATLDGSAWGGYAQAGLEIPVAEWFLDLLAGYRQTRGKLDVAVKTDAGAAEVANVRPVAGLYGRLGLRYRF